MKETSSIYRCSDEEVSIKKLQTIKDETFTPLTETGVILIGSDEVYWVKTIIKNNDTITRDFVVQFDNPRINKLQFFSNANGTIESSGLTGDDFPFNQRDYKNRNFIYPITIAPNESIDLYIYTNKKGENLSFYLKLWDRHIFEIIDSKEITLWSVYAGFFFCICLLVIFIALFTQRRLFFYFSIYCICITLNIISWNGFGYQYFWSNLPYFNDICNYSFTITYSVAIIAMTRNYLRLKSLFFLLDWILKSHQLLFLLLYLVFLFYKKLPIIIPIILAKVGNIMMLTYVIFILIAIISAYLKTKEKEKLFFLLGFTFFIGGFILFFLTATGVLESNFWTRYGVAVGWLLDIIILMFVFSNQIRQTYLNNTKLQKELTLSQLNAANALLNGQLEERKRLAQELHDGISIKMALLKIRLNNIFKPKREETTAIISEVNTISEDIRAFTHAISPLNLETETLEDAIEDLVYKVDSQTDITIHLSLEHFEENLLNNNQKYNLHQILQELFSNTIKYAQASSAQIELSTTEHQLNLYYQDNGKGFDVNEVKAGIGLKNIHSRAALLNGAFDIDSSEKGSRFEFSFKI